MNDADSDSDIEDVVTTHQYPATPASSYRSGNGADDTYAGSPWRLGQPYYRGVSRQTVVKSAILPNETWRNPKLRQRIRLGHGSMDRMARGEQRRHRCYIRQGLGSNGVYSITLLYHQRRTKQICIMRNYNNLVLVRRGLRIGQMCYRNWVLSPDGYLRGLIRQGRKTCMGKATFLAVRRLSGHRGEM